MKIDFENDLNVLKSNIKKTRIAYILNAALIVICNLVFIFVSDYYSQLILTIISIIIDILLLISLYIEIFVYLLRFKNVYKFLSDINGFKIEEKSGKLINISDKILLRKNIYVKELTFSNNGKNEIYYLLTDLYSFDGLKTDDDYFFMTKDQVVTEIKNEY